MTQPSSTLRPVIWWCLPTYAVVVVALALAFVSRSLPFRVQIGLSSAWMVLALILPIATLVAAVKAASVRFHAAHHQLQVWQPILAWLMVAVALTMNVLCYMVVGRALR